jgi:GNAT superfamily N-acetyltransferase
VDDDVTIRPALPGEGLTFAETKRAVWQAAYRGLLPDSYLDDLDLVPPPEAWEGAIEGGAPPFVATHGDRMVGVAAAGLALGNDAAPGIGQLYLIYALPEVWGTGVGARLHAACIARMRELGCTEAVLWVLEGNERAASFYRRMGWQPDGATLVDDRGEVMLHEVRFRRDLDDLT